MDTMNILLDARCICVLLLLELLKEQMMPRDTDWESQDSCTMDVYLGNSFCTTGRWPGVHTVAHHFWTAYVCLLGACVPQMGTYVALFTCHCYQNSTMSHHKT
jgi:hypothetical protein